MFVYHSGHVFSDGLASLHRVDGDGAGLFNAELTFETLLKVHLTEVQFGVTMVCPLKHKYTTGTKTNRNGEMMTFSFLH